MSHFQIKLTDLSTWGFIWRFCFRFSVLVGFFFLFDSNVWGNIEHFYGFKIFFAPLYLKDWSKFYTFNIQINIVLDKIRQMALAPWSPLTSASVNHNSMLLQVVFLRMGQNYHSFLRMKEKLAFVLLLCNRLCCTYSTYTSRQQQVQTCSLWVVPNYSYKCENCYLAQ